MCPSFTNIGTEKEYTRLHTLWTIVKCFVFSENFKAKFPEIKYNYLEYQGMVSANKQFREKDAINYILQQNKVNRTAYIPTLSNIVQNFQPNAHRHGKPPSQTKRFKGNSYSAWFSKLPSTQSFKLFSSNFSIVLYIQISRL